MWVATFLLSIVPKRGEKKTSLKSRREQSLKVTSGETARPVAGALPAPPALPGRSQSGRPAGSLGCAPTAPDSSRKSHSEKGGSVMMAARGRRLLPRSLPRPPLPARGPSPFPPTPRPRWPRADAEPRTTARGVPAPPRPRRAQSPVRTKQTTRPPSPSFLSPLTAWPPATSAVHAPNRGSPRGAERTRTTSGAAWRPLPGRARGWGSRVAPFKG